MVKQHHSISVVILAIIFTLLLFLIQNVNAQEEPSLVVAGEPTNSSYYSESPNGYWSLTDSKSEVYNTSNQNVWSGTGRNLSVVSRWIDFLSIEHTISCNYKWDEPPTQLKPKSELKMVSEYVNNEYSTTGKIPTGIKISVSKLTSSGQTGNEPIEVLKIGKDHINYSNEVKMGFIETPQLERGDKNMLLTVSCFVGSSRHVTTYIYSWVSTGD
ncbi:MAG: hypothetical protein ACRDFC_06605 [Ignavibacteria bacterium]